MNKRFILICCILIVIAISLTIFIITSIKGIKDTSLTDSAPAISTAFVDRCSIVTELMIKQSLNIEVLKKSSNATSCTYESIVDNIQSTVIVSVYYGDTQLYYLPDSYTDRIDANDLGDKGFYTNPNNGTSVAQLVKNLKVLTISVSSNANYTGESIKNLLSIASLNL